MTQYKFQAIGTTWQIDIYEELSKEKEGAVLSYIKNRIDAFDKAYSRFRDDSLVTKMSKEAGTFVLPDDAKAMLTLYHDLYKRTGGLFTPLVGNILSDAGYDAHYSLQQKKELEISPKWDAVLDYNHPNLTLKKPVILDFGAGGKGYLVDLVGEVLEENSISKYCIDAGGDILYKNETPIRVGLENPDDFNQVIGVFNLEKGSICGSAGNRRAWGNFTHIINPKTLVSPREISAVWVTADSALLADCLTTCLFFVKPSALLDTYKFEYLLIKEDKSFEKSDGFPGEVFVS